ncbi:MAG: hypothetical protein CMJ23_06175 [Phycisphaerae bacterium]|nr:hypothetical protein [Phycisphaerae bacterium]
MAWMWFIGDSPRGFFRRRSSDGLQSFPECCLRSHIITPQIHGNSSSARAGWNLASRFVILRADGCPDVGPDRVSRPRGRVSRRRRQTTIP